MVNDVITKLIISIFSYTGFFITFHYVSKFINIKSKKEELLTEKEINKILDEKFTIKDKFNMGIVIIGFLFVFLLLFFTLIFGLFYMQKNLFIEEEMIIFAPTITSRLVLSFTSLFITIGISSFFLVFFIHKFPRVERLSLQGRVKNFGLIKKNNYYNDISSTFKFIKISILISIPIIFLGLNNYSYVNDNNIGYNGFFSLNEKKISLEDIEKVETNLYINSDGGGITYKYVLFLKNEQKLNMKEGGLDDLLRLDEILKSKNIKFVHLTDDEYAIRYVEEHYNEDALLSIKKLMNISE